MHPRVKRYLIDAMSGMAQGLFASLLIGTIVKTLGQQLLRLGENPVFSFLVNAGNFATESHVVGAAMAVGIGFAMKVPQLVLFCLVAVGAAANVSISLLTCSQNASNCSAFTESPTACSWPRGVSGLSVAPQILFSTFQTVSPCLTK